MTTIYRAFDGKEFTSGTECQTYETEKLKKEIAFYDKNGQKIELFEAIKNWDDKVRYISAKTNESMFWIEEIVDEDYCLTGLGGRGFYFLGGGTLRWTLIEEYEQDYPYYIEAKEMKEKIERGN